MTSAQSSRHAGAHYEQLLMRTAAEHYLQRLSQKQIAKLHDVDPSTVSRWIAAALERNLVRISICPPPNEVLRKQLSAYLVASGLVQDVIVRGQDRSQVAQSAARYFEQVAQPNSTIVVDGGAAVADFVDALYSDLFQGMRILPIAAAPPSQSCNAYELSGRMARKYPIETACLRPPIWMDRHLDKMHRDTRRIARCANFVILGLTPWRPTLPALEFFRHMGLDPLRAHKQCVDASAISGYLVLNRQGKCLNLEVLEKRLRRCLGFSDLRQLSRSGRCCSILIASGPEEAAAVLAVLQAKLCNVLLLDESVAAALLNLFDGLA